jgi:cytochrome c
MNGYFKAQPLIILSAVTLLLFCSFMVRQNTADRPARILVFYKTKGWQHSSIPFGIAAIQKLGAQNNYAVDTTSNTAFFTDERLKDYRAIVFLNTTGNVLNGLQQAAFERYIQAGGGFAGIHAAADTEYGWSWYGKLVGAYFESHPNNPNVRKATVNITDNTHQATKTLPVHWERSDEWYNYRSYYPGIKVLAMLDENTYEGGTTGDHPISWYHEFDGGRAFYTGLGHTGESYNESLFLTHLAGGIKYAMGEGQPLNYSKAYAKVTPEQNRFVKTILTADLNSPMELAVAKDGRVFFTGLFGDLAVYNTRGNTLKQIIKLPVTNIGGTGLIGITLDPAFETNNYLYLYYAPAGQTDEPLYFQLARFTLSADNTLNMSSEKVLLKVPVQKSSGSHHGGSLAWDKNGDLYLSTGDSSSPFPSNGYSPLDERPGAEHYSGDSQRGAGNTNDLKGKILRIHPEADGTYTIPQGNLFAKGTDKTKPEIYIMGCRNPYRIAIDPKTSTLYWGDIGPDAGRDSIQGPRGYDEFNQARRAGNYGWPYFAGNNFAYAHWNFATNTAGPLFNAAAPVNNSPNNTGLNRLPPAQPAMIWYPYAASKEWPELGAGARCAIVGDFYHYDKNASSPYKLPEYYDNTLFVADWMRNWVMVLCFDEQQNYLRSEPFMELNGDFRRPIDMAFGADGVLYMLEYGSVYGTANKDARLVKIEYYIGNRPPVAKAAIVDSALLKQVSRRGYLTIDSKNIPPKRVISGQPPLKVSFTAKASFDNDDDDRISYEWRFVNKAITVKAAEAVYIYRKPGVYKAILKVTDKHGLSSRDTLLIKVGNTAPKVLIVGPDNKSFYSTNKPFNYVIKVSDKEDKIIDPKRIRAFYTYHAQPTGSKPGDIFKALKETSLAGKALIAASDCKACHLINGTAVGPAFTAIAGRYKTRKGSMARLAKKIITGGGGSWGTVHVMSAHPQISEPDAAEMVKYIFSVTDKKKNNIIPIPLQGKLNLKYNDAEPQGSYSIVAIYTDKGGKPVGPLADTAVAKLRYSSMNTAFSDEISGFQRFRNSLTEGGNKAYLLMKDIDMTGINAVVFSYGAGNTAGEIEIRLDSKAGPVIGSAGYQPTASFDKLQQITVPLSETVTGRHNVYFYAVKHSKPNNAIIKLTNISFVLK